MMKSTNDFLLGEKKLKENLKKKEKENPSPTFLLTVYLLSQEQETVSKEHCDLGPDCAVFCTRSQICTLLTHAHFQLLSLKSHIIFQGRRAVTHGCCS